jgi:hypothetical protein
MTTLPITESHRRVQQARDDIAEARRLVQGATESLAAHGLQFPAGYTFLLTHVEPLLGAVQTYLEDADRAATDGR